MSKDMFPAMVVLVLIGVAGGIYFAGAAEETGLSGQGSGLGVLWTSGDAEVAHRVCFMYTLHAKRQGWFDKVTLIVWGPSARLLAGDKDLQKAVKEMMAEGVKVQACMACANSYGVAKDLRDLGIDVKGMGKPLSDLLQSEWKMLTF